MGSRELGEVMGALSDLKRKLSKTNARAFEGLTFDQAPIAQEIRALDTWVGSRAALKPPIDLIIEALFRFSRTSTLTGFREAQLVCYGCIESFGQEKLRLIDDVRLFPKLLTAIGQYRSRPLAFRRCYRGLLSGYLGVDPDAPSTPRPARQNWQLLRNYLRDHLHEIQSTGFEPDWVGAIIGHENLLADDPCSRYGSSLLDGDASEFEEAKRKLDISNASWIITRLVVGQLDSTCSQNDSKFTHHVPRLLALLNEYRVVLDRGLSAILERYHRCEGAPANNALRDFAVTHWGNPWLSSNSGRWLRISQPARQMVVDWLKLDFIRQFFSLLAEHSANDKRRLKFWERYHKSIDDMYFALGSHARNNQSRDFIGLRKKMAGRVLDLNAGGSPRNNAFIMRMGDYIAVEFGVSGNACFIFERRSLPFDLDQKAVNGDRSALKHENHAERLLHIDTGTARWEQTFEQKLRGLINVRADEAAAPRSSSETRQHRDQRVTAIENRRASYSRKELERFCTTRSLVVDDFSGQRGNIWVRAGQSDVSLNRQLSEWGFQYRPGKGWWREAP
jgi:hypothetical protein